MADGIGSHMGNMEEEPFLVMTERDSDMPLAFLAHMLGRVHPEETDGETVDWETDGRSLPIFFVSDLPEGGSRW